MTTPESACLLIADISGYTGYLAAVELEHAQDILADLVSTVVTSLRPTFRLAKLEGDAAFTYAPTAKLDGSLLMDAIERCYFGFRRRRRDVRQATSCECNACVRIPDLDLKFVVHVGDVVRQRVFGAEELVGADVIVVHRLLKNRVVESTGIDAYAMFSEACTSAMAVDPEALGLRRHVETYEVIGEIPTWVEDLEARWSEENARARVLVEPDKAILELAFPVDAPPQLVWEYMTTPGRRVSWSAGVTDVIQEAPGNRRGVGATNHCMHGKDAVVEEILDWRPYDYNTLRSTMSTPGGQVSFLQTTEFEPTSTGTVVHMRFGPPRTAKERAILEGMGPMFEGMITAGAKTLEGLLDREVASMAAEAGTEPALPVPGQRA